MWLRTLPVLCLSLVVVACGGDDGKDGDTPVDCDVWYADADGDGFGDPASPVEVCSPSDEAGNADNDLDCNDGNIQVNPDASEVCDNAGLDEDCNGVANDDDDGRVDGIDTWADLDGDGFGDANSDAVLYCVVPGDRSETSDDCDDGDPAAFPGAAYIEDPTACMQDVDADGWGASTPDGTADPGTDCDDDADTTYPGATEIYGDLADQDCDGADDWFLFDDVELGIADPTVFAATGGDFAISDTAAGGYATSGQYSIELGGGNGFVTTITMNTTACDTMNWSYWGKRGPSAPASTDTLSLQYHDGNDWVDIDVWSGTSAVDADFLFRSGLIGDPAARHANMRMRLFSEGTAGGDQFFVDDFRFTCPGMDGDGDGFGVLDDCDDADPAHWYDCGVCTDGDGDDYGLYCDLGDDCDDADATINPEGVDLTIDGIDQDCNGGDGPSLFDDFELGMVDATVWDSITGDFSYDPLAWSGNFSLHFGGGLAVAESVVFDTSACNDVAWAGYVKRGPEQPDASEDFTLSWWDGSVWTEAGRVFGGATDPDFIRYSGIITDPAALWSGFKVRLENVAGTGTGFDDYFVDDVTVFCNGDNDGDGVLNDLDCDDADPTHWSDCGSCVDVDGDDFGLDCDLGSDCDDNNANAFPGQLDPFGDGVDTNCNGYDGPGLFEDFETGGVNALVWQSITGSVFYDSTYVSSGAYSLRLDATSEALTIPLDMGDCSTIDWSFLAQRADLLPETGDDLVFEWFNGSTWIELERVLGNSLADAAFVAYGGNFSGPLALQPGLQFRFTTDNFASDYFFVEDLSVRCGPPDNDGDGFDQTVDCDDNDPQHWADCGLCVDGDGDGYGVDCDLGADCDDADPNVSPGTLDPFGDGVDTDCNGFDGPGLYDGFEAGQRDPFIWTAINGDATYDTTFVHAGTYSLNLDGSSEAVTVALDMSTCPTIDWSFQVQRADLVPESGNDLFFDWWDGMQWTELARVDGDGSTDAAFVSYSGNFGGPSALQPGLQFRFFADNQVGDNFFVDELQVVCGPPDADGDGFTELEDCDDADPQHWSDCGLCVDADGDGFGLDCDFGDDCDDTDPLLNPNSPDPFGDGIDTDCSGFDGSILMDGFETGSPDPLVWDIVSGDFSYETEFAFGGAYSLRLAGTAEMQTVGVDLSDCPSLLWSYQAQRGPDAPDLLDDLFFDWWDGTQWIQADAIIGDGTVDPDFLLRSGNINDPAALHPDFKVRFVSDMSVATTDEIFIDDLRVECAGLDGDLDGFPVNLDCDDNDPAHWFDCGLCQDGDLDDYGLNCDLGPDCDDADATAYPGNTELPGDGIDQNCDGFDTLTVLYDDFDAGAVDPLVWDTLTGLNIGASEADAYSGDWSLNMDGVTSAISQTLDTSLCTAIVFRAQVKRAASPNTPEANDDLVVSYDDGTGTFIEATRVLGGDADADFVLVYAEINDPAAFAPTFRIKLENVSISTAGDDYFVDDFGVGCSEPDQDGDGFPQAVDCDEGDPSHWADCGTCVDLDGDDYGQGCDLGTDCDDGNAAVFPGTVDVLGDGIDADCSGVDGPGFFDDFETGETNAGIWATMVDEFRYDTVEVHNGIYSLRMTEDALAESNFTDTSICSSVVWSYALQRGPQAPDTGDDFWLRWWNGTQWIIADEVLGDGSVDASFLTRSGTILDAAALSPDFRIQLETDMSLASTDEVYIDDLFVTCGLGDLDGDGIDGAFDCDDADPAHWGDCITCVDLDGDDYGIDCDLGADCDDLDPQVFPSAFDPAGDGLDADCSGIDGPGFFDDFEDGATDFGIWQSMIGDFRYDGIEVDSGNFSLRTAGSVLAESQFNDTTACASLVWSYDLQRGPEEPDLNDDFWFRWWNGTQWIIADEILGDGTIDAGFTTRSGSILDAAALSPDFRIQIEADMNSTTIDELYIDNLSVACGLGDLDGDGVDGAFDCDDADAAHWSDCLTCVDLDGDDYGLDCDLGDDCDDADATVFFGAVDPDGDGIDQDCSGVDGPNLIDDFELGAPPLWWNMTGDFSYDGTQVFGGVFALNLAGAGAVIETVPMDTSACNQIDWEYWVKRGPETPDIGDDVFLDYYNGTNWVQFDMVNGNGATDMAFNQRSGTLAVAGALVPGFKIRMTNNGSGAGFDNFFFDDVSILCQ